MLHAPASAAACGEDDGRSKGYRKMQSLRCCLLAMQRDSSSKQADETADEREARHESAAAGLFRSVVAEATGGRVSTS